MILAKIRKAIGEKVGQTTTKLDVPRFAFGAGDHTRYAASIDEFSPDESEDPYDVANNRRRSSDGLTTLVDTVVDTMSSFENESGSLQDSHPYDYWRMAIWRAGVVTEPELW